MQVSAACVDPQARLVRGRDFEPSSFPSVAFFWSLLGKMQGPHHLTRTLPRLTPLAIGSLVDLFFP